MLYVLLLTAPLCKAGSTTVAPPVAGSAEPVPAASAGSESGAAVSGGAANDEGTGEGATSGTASSGAATSGGVTSDDAVHCATSTILLGAGSSYSTTLMARRVMEQGEEWSKVAALIAANPDTDTMVAAPFTLVEDTTVRVLATHLIERIANEKYVGPTLQLAGKQMDVDGTRYVVVTSYRVVHP